jgi:hypothetical protein
MDHADAENFRDRTHTGHGALGETDDGHQRQSVLRAIRDVRKDQPDVAIDFDVHYFVQTLDGEPKVFGWVSGDEQALLKKHGIIQDAESPLRGGIRRA